MKKKKEWKCQNQTFSSVGFSIDIYSKVCLQVYFSQLLGSIIPSAYLS